MVTCSFRSQGFNSSILNANSGSCRATSVIQRVRLLTANKKIALCLEEDMSNSVFIHCTYIQISNIHVSSMYISNSIMSAMKALQCKL